MQRPQAKLAAILLLLCSSLCAAATAAAVSRSADALLASGDSVGRGRASVASSLHLRALQQAQPESDHDHDHDHDTTTAVPSGTAASPVAAAPLAGQAAAPTLEEDHAHEEGEHSHGEEDHDHTDHSTSGPAPSGTAQPAADHDHDHDHEHEQHAGEEGHDHAHEAVKDGSGSSSSTAGAAEDHDHAHGHEDEHDHEVPATSQQGTPAGVDHDHTHEDDHDHAEEHGPTAGSNHDHDHDHGTEHSNSNNGDDSLSLRIAAVFIVLVGGVLGCALPAVLQGWLVRRPLVSACLRALSAGLLLALALLHVTTHAVEELDGLAEGQSAHDDHSVSSPSSSDPHVHRLLSELLLSGSLATTTTTSLASNDDLVKLLDQQLRASDSASASSWRRALLQVDDGHGHGAGQPHDHPFPMGMLAVLVGFLLMAALEHVVHALSHPAPLSTANSTDSCGVLEPNAKGGELGVVSVGITCEHQLSHAIANPNNSDPAGAAAACTDASCDKSLKVVIVQPTGVHGDEAHGSHGPVGHSHGPAGQPDLVSCCTEQPLASSLERFRLAVLAPVMELGCIFHSFIIGLSLGVLYAYSDVRTLLIALVFHQFLEGIGLLTVMVGAGMRRLQLLTAGLIFSLTCPVGIAVGIGISKSYNPESITARAVQGTLNGVSAGLLLYLSSALIQCEFGSQGMGRWKAWERLVIFGVIVLGAGVFSMLAIWA